jgi:hypothetical protein
VHWQNFLFTSGERRKSDQGGGILKFLNLLGFLTVRQAMFINKDGFNSTELMGKVYFTSLDFLFSFGPYVSFVLIGPF